MRISPILGTTPTQKAISTTVMTVGATAVAAGAFALLKGYVPVIGSINLATAKTLVVLGSTAMALPVVVNATNYGLQKAAEKVEKKTVAVKSEERRKASKIADEAVTKRREREARQKEKAAARKERQAAAAANRDANRKALQAKLAAYRNARTKKA